MTRTIEDLSVRVSLAQASIKILEGVDDGDPRKDGAIEHYKTQLAKLQSELDEATALGIHAQLPIFQGTNLIASDGQVIPPTIVPLRTASLFGSVRRK